MASNPTPTTPLTSEEIPLTSETTSTSVDVFEEITSVGAPSERLTHNREGALSRVYHLGQCCAITASNRLGGRKCRNFVDFDGVTVVDGSYGPGICSVHLSLFRDQVGHALKCEKLLSTYPEDQDRWLEHAIHFLRDLKNPDLRKKRNRRFFLNSKEGGELIAYLREVDPDFVPVIPSEVSVKELPKYQTFCEKHNIECASSILPVPAPADV